jgi:hypothetical protein
VLWNVHGAKTGSVPNSGAVETDSNRESLVITALVFHAGNAAS